jgi:hypothetical protein
MKERFLYDDEFEKQLKDKADQFKMYPSDKVWNEVYSTLHTRRRRFVAGMTVLIGSILILAGSELIFPSQHSISNPVAAKINTLVKPATAADLQSFTTNDFINAQADNSRHVQAPEGNRVSNDPFVMQSVSSYRLSGNRETTENLSEKIMTATRVKTNSPDNLDISGKLGISIAVAEIQENLTPVQDIPAVNTVSAEISPEKSATQLTHIRNDRFSWEIYVTPTLNTHYLTGLDYQTMAQSIQTAPIMLVNVSNVNGFVDNTPVLGYNLGGNILYKLSKNISLKAGLEFSFNRYYIKAYNSGSPQTSVALNSYFGYVADSLNAVQGFGTDKNPQHYQNRYYQLSMPVGIEMKVAGNGKVQFHLGASLQPSYLLNTDAYVLSNDYKGYIKDAQAFRRWNLNAGAEAFISYSVGNIRWELGPQVRYQIFSTYKNSYPLKENMLNYGIRIGISKTIR